MFEFGYDDYKLLGKPLRLSGVRGVFSRKIGPPIFLENVLITNASFNNFDDYLVSFEAPSQLIESLNLVKESVRGITIPEKYHDCLKENSITIRYRKVRSDSTDSTTPIIWGQFIFPGSLSKNYIPVTCLQTGSIINLECQWNFWKNDTHWGWSLSPYRLQVIPSNQKLGNLGRMLLANRNIEMIDLTDNGLKNVFETSLRQRLSNFNKDIRLDDLKWILEKTGGYLTGSFLLATLLESDHFLVPFGSRSESEIDKCDLDIFLPANVNPVYYAKKVWGDQCIEKELRMSNYNPLKHVYSIISNVINLRNGIQFILVDPEHCASIPEYINNYFDLNIIKGAYTPNILYLPPNLEGVFRGQGHICSTLGPTMSQQRLKRVFKYIYRGFWIKHVGLNDRSVLYRSNCGHLTYLDLFSHREEIAEYCKTSGIVEKCYSCFKEEQQRILSLFTELVNCHQQLGDELFTRLMDDFTNLVPLSIQINLSSSRLRKLIDSCFQEYIDAMRNKTVIAEEQEFGYLRNRYIEQRNLILRKIEVESFQEINSLLDRAGTVQTNLNRSISQFDGYNMGISPLNAMNRLKCLICDLATSRIFIPCGHYISCEDCSDEILKTSRKCPVCRTKIKESLKVYT